MCETTTILTVVSLLYTGYADKEQKEYQQKVSQNNAIIQQRQATDAINRGKRDEHTQRLRAASSKSKQAAALGAQGLDLGSGSAAEVLVGAAELGELDALTIRDNASRQAYGHTSLASDNIAQGELYATAGDQAVAGSVLTSSAQVADEWYTTRNRRQAA